MDIHVHSLHVSVELEEINFVCGICKHEFTINEDYKDHVKIHDKKDNFQTVTPDQDKDLDVGKLHMKKENIDEDNDMVSNQTLRDIKDQTE